MKLFQIIFFLCFSTLLFSQKVDIDNYRVDLELANIPEKYIPEEKRTYHVEVKGPPSIVNQVDKEKISIYGYKRVEKEGTLKLVLTVSSLIQGKPTMSTRVDEKKDKDGKVISKTNYYHYYSDNSSDCSIAIFGPLTPEDIAKEQAKEKEKAAKNKKEEKPNPFLAKANNNANNPSGEIAETSNYKRIKDERLSLDYRHSGGESTSGTSALNSYNQGAAAAYNNHANQYLMDAASKSSDYVNKFYGFYPVRLTWQKMRILDTDKHPEHNTFKQATEAAKVLFKNMKYDSNIEIFRTDFQPILEYFDGLDAKLGSADKYEKKLKAAALYNIAMINYSLDRFDPAEAACKKMIAIKQDEGDAEKLLEKIMEVKKEMNEAKLTTRHIKVM